MTILLSDCFNTQIYMEHFEPETFRQHFQLIRENALERHGNNSPIVYLDNGATTQKPEAVIDCYQQYYKSLNANVHRGSHRLSAKATDVFEQARVKIKHFINADSAKEIIWTKGTTESINLLAASLSKYCLNEGDEILVSVSEHHANIVPWQIIAQQTGSIIKVMPLDKKGEIDLQAYTELLTTKTKIVCCTHVSNVLGKINPLPVLIQKAKTYGAITIIDGAQAIPHFAVDVQELDCDFYVFSAHKMYGPTGVGVLYGKKTLLEKIPPYQSGGEMIDKVSFKKPTTFNSLPFKFEAGTPNIAGIVAFAQAINFINQFKANEIKAYEQQLTRYCYGALKQIEAVNLIVEGEPDIPVISFTVDEHHNHDIATSLDSFGIAVRSGHHCAMPLMEYLNISGCLRVSLAAYNTFAEIDYFIEKLHQLIEINNEHYSIHTPLDKVDTQKISSNDSSTEILDKFMKVRSWDSRHREIMLLGKQLTRISRSERNEESLISGCESLAWLVAEKDSTGLFYYRADSDAKIIRGLLVIVLAAYNGKSADEIISFNIDDYFNKLGLMQHLSPSRGNGVLAIVEKIKNLVKK